MTSHNIQGEIRELLKSAAEAGNDDVGDYLEEAIEQLQALFTTELEKVEVEARLDENSREAEYTFNFQSTEEFKDGFDEAIRQTVEIIERRDKELEALSAGDGK